MPFRKYLEEQSFSPDAVKAMSEALTRVCRELDDAGIPRYSTTALVQMITSLASAGVTDPERLSHAVFQSILESRAVARVRPEPVLPVVS
jgi:hypothetical protein